MKQKQALEYKVVNVGYGRNGAEELQRELNDEAHRGWDLYSVMGAVHGGFVLVFYREATKNVQ